MSTASPPSLDVGALLRPQTPHTRSDSTRPISSSLYPCVLNAQSAIWNSVALLAAVPASAPSGLPALSYASRSALHAAARSPRALHAARRPSAGGESAAVLASRLDVVPVGGVAIFRPTRQSRATHAAVAVRHTITFTATASESRRRVKIFAYWTGATSTARCTCTRRRLSSPFRQRLSLGKIVIFKFSAC